MDLLKYLSKKNLRETLINPSFQMKIKNFTICNINYLLKNKVVKSYPYLASLNTTNRCNLRCKFCEIHYFYKKANEVSGKVFPNNIDIETLKNYSEWLKYLGALHLTSATGEPFTNPNIGDVVHYLKKYGISLSADTNGLLIDQQTAEQLVVSRFDSLNFSIHAGDSETYLYLQGGDFNRVLHNLKTLVNLKEKYNSNYPKININFGLNKINANSIKNLMQLVKVIGVDTFNLYHYYGGRNALNKRCSLYFDVETCNNLLKDVYEYAQKINLIMVPTKPPYLSNLNEDVTINPDKKCSAPWTTIKFKGCVEYENSEYISVCNRILLFRIDYKKFYDFKENTFLKNIWNHEILQYFRESVNSKDSNSICKFCKDPDTPKIRCIDNVEYSHRRDKAVKDFFNEFRNSYEIKEVSGLTLLDENPYKYEAKDGF